MKQKQIKLSRIFRQKQLHDKDQKKSLAVCTSSILVISDK